MFSAFHGAFPDVCFAWHSADLVTGGDDTSLYLWSFSSPSSSFSSASATSPVVVRRGPLPSSFSSSSVEEPQSTPRCSWSDFGTPPRLRLVSLTIQSILQGRYLPGGGSGINRLRNNQSEASCAHRCSSLGDCLHSSSSSFFPSRGGLTGGGQWKSFLAVFVISDCFSKPLKESFFLVLVLGLFVIFCELLVG